LRKIIKRLSFAQVDSASHRRDDAPPIHLTELS